MNEMIKRVAQAMQTYDDMATLGGYEGLACAAIEAMRKPTRAMYDAAEMDNGRGGDYDGRDADSIWSAMIDAALKEDG